MHENRIATTLLGEPHAAIRVAGEVFRETLYGVVKRLRFIVAHVEAERVARRLETSEVRILDLGCGTGTYVSIPLAQIGYSVLGVDTDRASIERARRNAAGLDGASFFAGRLEEIAVERPFHVGICSEVLEHLGDPPALLSEISGRLALDGLLLATIPNGYGYFELESWIASKWLNLPGLADDLEKRMVQRFGSAALKERHAAEYGGRSFELDVARNELEQSTLATDSDHVQRFTPRKARRVLEEGGFRVLEFRNNTFLAGNALNALVRSLDRVLDANARLADRLPSWLVCDWLIAARKREGGTSS